MKLEPICSMHIFICYSSKDEAAARGVVEALEARGLTCWISCRDVLPGHNYQESIVQALETAKGFIFLLSESAVASSEIKKELSLAGSLNIPVFPLRLSPILPTGALRYELATRQWIDMFPDANRALGRLAETIHNAVAARAADETLGPAKAPKKRPRKAAAAPTAPAPATPAAAAPVVAAGSPEFEAIRILLARHIGPIAKVLMQKAAAEARTRDDFCERLAARVNAPAERAAFLQAARAHLSAKS